VVFAIAVAILPNLLVANIRANGYARCMTAATNFAQEKLEQLRSAQYADVANGSDQVAETGTRSVYARSWTVTAGPTETTKKAVVTVSWTDKPKYQVKLETIIGE
jgi:hypothetical protein